jgi:hypothetical protein
VIEHHNTAFHKVPATGGTPTPVTRLADGKLAHRWPVFLPDGRSFLFVDDKKH